MAGYTRVNLKEDVKDMAPEFGMEGIESHFARTNLELGNSGLSYFRLDSGFRAPFGHTHSEQEEIYVIISGSGRVAVGDEIVAVGQ
jgi:mannose-6-phosphate isomerase-like protein (cupin superfamily)